MNRRSADVVVVGGGVIGSSIALQLRQRRSDLRVVVVERDPTYARASSHLATGGIRQLYGSRLNVSMAKHSVAFYQQLDALTAATHRPSRAWFRQRGYLLLADATRAAHLERRHDLARASGARVERWTPARAREYVPGLILEDIVLAVFGPDDGYLDPREALAGMRTLAEHAGAEFLHGEVRKVERSAGRVTGVCVAAGDEEHRIDAPVVVNAAGAYSAAVAACAAVSVPITPMRQHLFRLELEAPLPSRIPMLFDPDGTHWRLDDARSPNEPERLVLGRSNDAEVAGERFDVDPALLDVLIATLRRRYPAARIARLVEAWAGLYEMTPDHNGIIGMHPELEGFVIAAGFSGHGLMLAPATGVAVAELILDGRCISFDVAPLAVDRFAHGLPFLDGAMV